MSEQSVSPAAAAQWTAAARSIFEDQFRLAAAKIQHGIEDKGLVVGLCPTTEVLLDCVAQGIQTSSDEVRGLEIHGPPFSLGSGGLDYTIKRHPESRNIRVSWLVHHNPQGLLVLIDWHRYGRDFLVRTGGQSSALLTDPGRCLLQVR